MEAIKNTLHIGSSSSSAGAPPRYPSADEVKSLRQKYQNADQEHVFNFYDALPKDEQAHLYHQLAAFDPDYINTITKRALHPGEEAPGKKDELQPLPESATASILDSEPGQLQEWYESGLELTAKNKVAVVLMAGGQGTRLGSSAPKGCFDIGLPSKKSLFQIQAERIRRLQVLARNHAGLPEDQEVVVPWYIMTSGPTRGPTQAFLEENNHFGLDKENVVIFEQGVLPCVSDDGKILLETKGKVAVAPDGNGGIYQALATSPVLGDLRRRGIEHVHSYCVDNCLVRVGDPTLTGFAASKGVEIATKVVRKRSAAEPVGLIVSRNGRPDVVEYSEIDRETAEARDPGQPGLLRLRAANIVNHYYSIGFLDGVPGFARDLPHHVARKKIPHVDPRTGEAVRPDRPNGIKLEQFVFDVFPRLALDRFACLEVRREDEFSPLKNARGAGEDDPDTSKRDIMDQGKRWLEAAGAILTGDGGAGVEVSPLVSYGGEGLAFLKGKEFALPAVVAHPAE